MKYFLDYLQISFNVTTKGLSKKDLEMSHSLLYNLTRPLNKHFKPTQTLLNVNNKRLAIDLPILGIEHLLKDYNYNRNGFLVTWNPIHHNICLHFKGSFFFKNKSIQDDLVDCKKLYDPVFDNIRTKFSQYYEKPPLITGTISKLDIAINHYNQNLINAKAIFHKGLSSCHKYIDPRTNITTSINLGSFNSKKLYFRSYDKNYEKGTNHSSIRFNSKNLVRNEWSCRADFLREHKIRSIFDLEEVIFNKRKRKNPKIDGKHINQFINYLRTLRDVIPKSRITNPYKIVHYDKGYKVFKNLKPLNEIKTKIWIPDDQVYGTMSNHIDDMTDETLHNIIYLINIKRKSVVTNFFKSSTI